MTRLVFIWYFPGPLFTRAFSDAPLLACREPEWSLFPHCCISTRVWGREYLNPCPWCAGRFLRPCWVQLKWRVTILTRDNLRSCYSDVACLLLLKRKMVGWIGGRERRGIWVNTGQAATGGEGKMKAVPDEECRRLGSHGAASSGRGRDAGEKQRMSRRKGRRCLAWNRDCVGSEGATDGPTDSLWLGLAPPNWSMWSFFPGTVPGLTSNHL